MSKITDKIIDVTGRLLRKIPNVPGKHFYSKKLIKPIINRLDAEQTLELRRIQEYENGNDESLVYFTDQIL